MELENLSSARAKAEVISGQISKLLVIICHFNTQMCKYMAHINKRLKYMPSSANWFWIRSNFTGTEA